MRYNTTSGALFTVTQDHKVARAFDGRSYSVHFGGLLAEQICYVFMYELGVGEYTFCPDAPGRDLD